MSNQNDFSMKIPVNRSFTRFVSTILFALIYYQMAEISRTLASTPQNVTPVWPPDGFASAIVFIFGYWTLIGVFIGSFLSNMWAFINTTNIETYFSSILQVIAIAIGTTLGTYVGVYLFKKKLNNEYPLEKIKHVFYFLIYTAILGTIINASFGVSALTLGGKISSENYQHVWFTWWISNVSGILIFTPFLLSWYKFLKTNKLSYLLSNNFFLQKRVGELFTISIIVIMICVSSFWNHISLEYMLIPCLIWASFRFGELFVTTLIVFISTLAVTGTVRDLGVFSQDELNDSLILLEIFIGVIVFTFLIFNAILQERKEAFKIMSISHNELRKKSLQNEKYARFLKEQNISLEEARQEAILANQSKSDFLANMSHELRTPLNAILGIAQILHNEENLSDRQQEDINIIYESGNHLLSLINDILDLSKIEAGKLDIQYQKFDLYQLLQTIFNLIKTSVEAKNLTLNCTIKSELSIIIESDQKRLKQILLNILGNAIKFTNQGQITFEINILNQKQKQDILLTTIEFKIEDTGIGISPENLQNIFLAFEQFGNKNYKSEGTGLGLAIAQKIAQLMGGKIIVTSELGKGSIFSLILTVPTYSCMIFSQLDQKQSTKTKSLVQFDSQLSEKLPFKILLAEDNLVNQKVAQKMFNKLGYDITIAINGFEVLSALEKEVYDIIFMDIQMPQLDGIETTNLIMEKYVDRNCPYIIAMTANAMDGDRNNYLEIGMKDYLSKPVKINAIIEALYQVKITQEKQQK